MAEVIKPPGQIPYSDKRFKLFIAGSIENGLAEEFGKKIEDKLKNHNIIIYNPRRDDWDSSLKPSSKEPVFNEQVNWELDAMDNSNLITFYFQPGTMSPISMLELGLRASKGNVIVCCPEGFFRKGNVDIVCERYNITMVNDFEEFLDEINLVVKLSI